MIAMYLDTIHCDEGTDEIGADEPYVLVTVVDLVQIAPRFEVVRFGPFKNFFKGKTQPAHFTPNVLPSFWGFPFQTPPGVGVTGTPASLKNPDQAIFVVSLGERGGGNPETLRVAVKAVVGASVLSSLSLDRAAKLASLISDVNSAMGIPTGVSPFQDDAIGGPQELRFSIEELAQAESGQTVSKTLTFAGQGGLYTLTFQARTFERQLRRFLTTREFDLSRGISLRSLQPPVTSLRAFMEV